MLISNVHSCVFLHVPKTGGTSMKKALRRACCDAMVWPPEDYGVTDPAWWHVRATTVRNCIGEERWGRYFKFAFIRNPWGRLVSLYNMLVARELCRGDFAALAASEEKNQLDYFSDAAGNRMIDFVGRFEQLENDFDYVCRHVGVTAVLPHLNVTAKVNYRDYYTPELRQLVAERFARDIQTFGYEF